MAQQFSNPLSVFYVRLSTRHFLDVLRIGYHNFEGTFEDGVDRFPVHTRAFHRDMSTSCRHQPILEVDEFPCGGTESTHFFFRFSARCLLQQTSDNSCLMHVQTTPALDL